MKHEDKEIRLFAFPSKLLLCLLNILLKLANRIFQSGPSVVNLIHNEYVLANKVCHLQRTKIQPLCPSHLGPRNLLGVTTAQIFVER